MVHRWCTTHFCATRTATVIRSTSTGTATGGTGITTGSASAGMPSAPRLARNSLHFSPALAGEFCLPRVCSRDFFASWPYHPPSIFPTSFSGSESAMYFLVSSDLASQRTERSTLSVSAFLMARRT